MTTVSKLASLRAVLDAADASGAGGMVSVETVREALDAIAAEHPFVTMTTERAREITRACVQNFMSRSGITAGDYVPLPAGVSLEEMLVANRIVSGAAGTVTNPDGSHTTLMHVDPRGVAAAYAFEQYRRSPEAMLNAVGYSLRASDDESDD